jgi:tetratricopeptide (TPR) repeat protein
VPMPSRLLVELAVNGNVAVSTWPTGGRPELISRSSLAWPLDSPTLEDLRWYLEDYLRIPSGVWGERGPAIQAQLPVWGQEVFSAVFGPDAAYAAYQRARQQVQELVFQSSEPSLLGLPWELMCDPLGPVVLNTGGISRTLPAAESPAKVEVPDGQLRVLMVICRPAGTGDVMYQMIARPLLERLKNMRTAVHLTVLRPPTLDMLRKTLVDSASAGRPFHLVHFDSHGSFVDGKGNILLEHRYGGPRNVPASELADAVSAGAVPLTVLNSCHSGAVGKEVETAVATALLQAGCASVVAMAYSVHAVAAAEFMSAFYESLFAGSTVNEAVGVGRRRLFEHDKRPSAKGDLPLADWLVPVHYWRADLVFPHIQSDQGVKELSGDEPWTHGSRSASKGADLRPVGSFVGRDDAFYELESVVRTQHVVVLHGPAGTGKTELAKAFGRWWRDTAGTDDPAWVIWHSFEPGAASFGLNSVIKRVGLTAYGSEFAKSDPGDQFAKVKQLLAENSLLLLWDNFETVKSMPDTSSVAVPLNEEGLHELQEFLAWLAEYGTATVIITSRTDEEWLSGAHRIRIGGLSHEESAEYAGLLIPASPEAAQHRQDPAFGELLNWLNGHPLGLRLTIPRLGTLDPGTLLAELQGTTGVPIQGESEGERTGSLTASITYSYIHLSDVTRRLIPAISLFRGAADAGLLSQFSGQPQVPERFSGFSEDDWKTVLDDASGVGLLTPVDGRVYDIHPALPAYLTAQWRAECDSNFDRVRNDCLDAMVTACSAVCWHLNEQVRFGEADRALDLLDHLRYTFGSLLRHALDHQMWDEAQVIVQPLEPYWRARGLSDEADAWINQILATTQDPGGTPRPVTEAAGRLWVVATSMQANEDLHAMRLDDAERRYRQLLLIQDQPGSPQMMLNQGVSCLQLGTIAKERGDAEGASAWFHKALAIFEEADDQHRIMITCHQLGMLAELRQRPTDAEKWYFRSLAIAEQSGIKTSMAATYFQLGVIASKKGRPNALDAQRQFLKALPIFEELGDQPHVTAVYHELGGIAIIQGLPDVAENWLREALLLGEKLGDKPTIAAIYYQLGVVAFAREQLEEAVDWVSKSLAVRESLNDWPHIAECYTLLARICQSRDQTRTALEWCIRCVSLFDEFPHPLTQLAAEHLARLSAQLGTQALRQSWLEVTDESLPQDITKKLNRLGLNSILRDIAQVWRTGR